jgi:hypothetical protein
MVASQIIILLVFVMKMKCGVSVLLGYDAALVGDPVAP